MSLRTGRQGAAIVAKRR